MQEEKVHEIKRIEKEEEVLAYVSKLKYALQNGKITFQKDRKVDEIRDEKFTNRYTMLCLFPDEDEIVALRRELARLAVDEYIETVKDTRFKKRSEMRVFSRKYLGEDVYIKIRVELLSSDGKDCTFVMSFHFAERPCLKNDFPYRKRG